MSLIEQKKNKKGWIAQNYSLIFAAFLTLLLNLILSFVEKWIPFQYLLLIFSLLIANAMFFYLAIQKNIEENSKLIIWLKFNLTAIFLYFVVMGFSFLFVYGVGSIPDSILPILWAGAFFTVASILLFRLHRLMKNGTKL